jgi:hypothetical protein
MAEQVTAQSHSIEEKGCYFWCWHLKYFIEKLVVCWLEDFLKWIKYCKIQSKTTYLVSHSENHSLHVHS